MMRLWVPERRLLRPPPVFEAMPLIAVAPAPTPPAGGGGSQPNLSAGQISSMGITVGALTDLSIDPASSMWDSGTGGTPCDGSTNGGLTNNVSNAALVGGVLQVKLASSSSGCQINTWPKPGASHAGDGSNASPGGWSGNGASSGFVWKTGILEVSFKLPGPTSSQAYAWPAIWGVDPANATELDQMEIAGWSGAGGEQQHATITYRDNGTVVTTSPWPSWGTYDPGGHPVADGSWHTVTYVRKSNRSSYVYWDATSIISWTEANSANFPLILSYGISGSQGAPPSYPAIMQIQYCRYWAIS